MATQTAQSPTVAANKLRADLYLTTGADLSRWTQPQAGAVARTVLQDLKMTIRPEHFGAVANGIADDLVPIQNALAAGQATGYPVVFSGKVYALSGGITFDLEKCSYFGNGAQLNFTTAVDGTICTTVIDGGTAKEQHVIDGFEFVGRDRFGTQIGTRFNSATTGAAAITTMRACAWRLFGTGIRWDNNAFLNHFYGCTLRNNGICVDVAGTGSADAQENIVFFGGAIYNSETLVRVTEAGVNFYGTSLDYPTQRHFDIGTAGVVCVFGGHIEGGSDADYWIDVTGADASFSMFGGALVKPNAYTKTAFPIGYAATTSASAINFNNVSMAFDLVTYGFPYLVDGYGSCSGLAWVNGGSGTASDQVGVVSHSKINALLDGGFEQTTLVDFYTGSTGAISTSATLPRTGSRSMAIAPAAGQIGAATVRIPCDSGQWGIAVVHMNTAGWGTDAIRLRAEFLDRLGNTIGAAIDQEILAAARPVAYTRFAIRPAFQAPVGTAHVAFTITKRGPAFTNSDGAGVLYVDDAYVQVFGAGRRETSEKSFFNRTAVAANTTFVCPNGFSLEGVKIKNNTANAVTGGIRIGTAGGGAQVVASIAVAANADLFVPQSALLLNYFSTTAAQTLFFEAVTAWNAASLDVSFIFRRIA